jgi:hypothetical protein
MKHGLLAFVKVRDRMLFERCEDNIQSFFETSPEKEDLDPKASESALLDLKIHQNIE